MRSTGSPAELEHRRYLAIRRLLEGSSTEEVAEFLDVEVRSVQRWWRIFRQRGWKGLAATAGAGRPQKLTFTQEKIVIRWLQETPTDFGFTTELRTCRRLSGLIWQEWRIRLQPRYLPRWLRERGFTLQKPERVPRERDNEAIASWLATDWPRIKKKTASERAHLVVIDESGLLMAPLVKRTWALRGHRPVLFQKGKHREKVSLATALWLSPQRDCLGNGTESEGVKLCQCGSAYESEKLPGFIESN